ncbi:MAG: protoporphyrinogen oxidase [Raineya sp.]
MIVIVGAGISGLSLAYYLQKQNKPYLLLELESNKERPGGYMQSIREKEYLFELGPNSLLCDTDMLQLIEELALSPQVVEANKVSKNRYIFKQGRYQKLPTSPLSLILSSFFSWKTKLKIFREAKVSSKTFPEETLSEFFERRFGKEVVEYALDPFVSGIYAGNPQELLVAQTFPSLVEMEKQYGSILKGLKKNKSSERKKTLSFKDGLQTLPRALAKQVKITYSQKGVEQVQKNRDGSWQVFTAEKNYQATQLVVATAAFQAAEWFRNSLPKFGESLLKVPYVPMIVVHTIYYKQDLNKALNGFGALHPSSENLFTLGHIWSSSVFSGRCKDNEVLFTSFIGGSKGYQKTLLEDHQIMAKVQKEIRELYGVDTLPVLQKITRWEKAIPQYDQYCLEALQQAENLEKENLFICANWKGGVSIADCIKKAKNLAKIL